MISEVELRSERLVRGCGRYVTTASPFDPTSLSHHLQGRLDGVVQAAVFNMP